MGFFLITTLKWLGKVSFSALGEETFVALITFIILDNSLALSNLNVFIYFERLIFSVLFIDSTIILKIFETNSNFHVKMRTTGKTQFLFFRRFLLVTKKIISGGRLSTRQLFYEVLRFSCVS